MKQGTSASAILPCHQHYLPLNRRGTTDDFTTSFLHFSLFSTALWDLASSRPVRSLMFLLWGSAVRVHHSQAYRKSSHLFLCLPCRLPPFTVPCKMVFVWPDERKTCLHHCSLRLFMLVGSSFGPIACWILAQTFSLVTWSLFEMRSILQ